MIEIMKLFFFTFFCLKQEFSVLEKKKDNLFLLTRKKQITRFKCVFLTIEFNLIAAYLGREVNV